MLNKLSKRSKKIFLFLVPFILAISLLRFANGKDAFISFDDFLSTLETVDFGFGHINYEGDIVIAGDICD